PARPRPGCACARAVGFDFPVVESRQYRGPANHWTSYVVDHITGPSRVEEWRGGLGRGLVSPVARPFVRGCPTISTMLRFHSPLIEPDGPYSRIRLSDKAHSPLRTRRAARPCLEAVKPQFLVQVALRELCLPGAADLVLCLQPL